MIFRTLSMALVVALPLLQALRFPVGGAWGTGVDLLAAALWLAAVLHWLRSGRPRSTRGAVVAVLVAATGGWVAISGVWGFHPEYALAKGSAVVLWGGVALAIAVSGVSVRRWAELWSMGTVATLLISAVALALVPEAVSWSGGSSVGGLPRLRGPVLHPNLFGDWLAVSFWLAVGMAAGVDRRWAWVAGACAVALAATLSTALAGVGVGAVLWGWARRGGAGRAGGTARLGRAAWIAGGAALAAGVGGAAVLRLRLTVLGVPVETTGLRPAIWADAWRAITEAPLLGVGAAPYLARAVEPGLEAAGPVLWDAHSLLLSIWGQFGVIGVVLYGGLGAALGASILRPGGRAGQVEVTGPERAAAPPAPEAPGAVRVSGAERAGGTSGGADAEALRIALACALVGALVHGLFTASEDLRHLWVLLGIAGAAGSLGAAGPGRLAAVARDGAAGEGPPGRDRPPNSGEAGWG